jgi:hypothetical protein
MTDPDPAANDLRSALVAGLRAGRDAERHILAALAPVERDASAADGGWSPKDVQAHLSAWRSRQVERLVASREGREAPALEAPETDDMNAIFHARRAAWSWDEVVADADASADALIAEVDRAEPSTISEDRMVGSILGNGPEHVLAHLPKIAARVGLLDRVDAVAATVAATVERGGWPPRSAAFARYNLACYHALAGRLDAARALLRVALPDQPELRELAPQDDDLIALRGELPDLAGERPARRDG